MRTDTNKNLHKRRPFRGDHVIHTASGLLYECEKSCSQSCILRPTLGFATFEVAWKDFHQQYTVKH